jgi:predicted Zn-dependent protease
MVLDRLGDSQGAKAALQAAVRSNPEDSLARMLLGRLLLNQDQAAAARTELERACQIDPQSINARYALYQAQTKLGDQAAAEKTLAAFRELKKREKSAMDVEDIRYDDERDLRRFTAGFHTAVASQLLPRGAEDAAEAHLLQAVRVDPAETQAREMLASLYLRQRRLADARPVLAQLVALQPRDTAARLNFATVLLQLRDPAAVPELQRVLELDPRNPPALHNLARFYLATRQQLPEALSLCQRLIAIQPAAVNFDLLGWACYANHRTNDALAASAQAVEKDPSNPDYRQRYERLKQAAGANR